MSVQHPDLSAGEGPAPDEAAAAARVADLLRTLGSTVRSYRLYSGNGPMLERFVDTLRQKFVEAWEELPSLQLRIDEQAMFWGEHRVFPSGDSGGDLAFMFYKDGIREITFSPGFEDELAPFLSVLAAAPQVQEDEDDLITLLWREQFTALKYEYVELGIEGGGPALVAGEPPARVDPAAVRQASQQPSLGITPDDFQETLYFLDEEELRRLADEVRLERERDLWTDVLNALYDRLEDGSPERQARIVHVLAEVLPSMLAGAAFEQAAGVLRELAALAARPGLFAPPVLRDVRELFGQLARPQTVVELVKTLESDPDALQSQGLQELLSFFPPATLAPLSRAVEAVQRPDVRRVLDTAVQRLAEGNRGEVVRLLSDSDPAVVATAVRWVGNLRIGSATSEVVAQLRHPSPAVRLAAIEALVELGAASVGAALLALLEDPERDVRIAAAKALSALKFVAARSTLEEAIGSKRLRAADRTEKLTFFEAFGALAGGDGVELLDRILNSRSWLGRGESPEDRACAAMGLARVRHPAARAALLKAAKDPDPVVRSAVSRAVREEA